MVPVYKIQKQSFLKLFVLALLLIPVLSCEEETEWELQKAESVMVVDAILTDELKQQEIFIQKSVQDLNQQPEFISDATVKVYVGNIIDNDFEWKIEYEFHESETEPGRYVSSPFAIAYDQIYALVIDYNDFHTEAFATGAYISELRKDTVYQKDDLYAYVYTGSNSPAITEVYYDWSHNSEYCEQYGSCYAAETFYTLNFIEVSEEFSPAKQEILFPAGTTITRRKYSLSNEHQKFIRSLLIETEWRGGLFDVEYGNVPTNFSNGANGWFAVCMVLQDQKTIN